MSYYTHVPTATTVRKVLANARNVYLFLYVCQTIVQVSLTSQDV